MITFLTLAQMVDATQFHAETHVSSHQAYLSDLIVCDILAYCCRKG